MESGVKMNADIKWLDNPEVFDNRILHVIDYLDQELYEEKVVLFTNFIPT